MRSTLISFALVILVGAGAARAADRYTVAPYPIRDERAVIATVESRNIIAARIRTPGTITTVSVREGDWVTQGQVIAVVTDKRLKDQADALDALIVGLKAQESQALAERDRNRPLLANGVTSQSAMDSLLTAAALAAAAVKARVAERSALAEQMTQGNVPAPATGRVLSIGLAAGSVAMSGETVATVAKREVVVRLNLPESTARDIKLGDSVRIEGIGLPAAGSISLIYPHIEEGRMAADLRLPDSPRYFVGQRVRAWLRAAPREAIAIPPRFLSTHFGIDYVRVAIKGDATIDVPVLRGHAVTLADSVDGIEILSGLKAGDVLVSP